MVKQTKNDYINATTARMVCRSPDTGPVIAAAVLLLTGARREEQPGGVETFNFQWRDARAKRTKTVKAARPVQLTLVCLLAACYSQ
jgi:hypothetical protein